MISAFFHDMTPINIEAHSRNDIKFYIGALTLIFVPLSIN